MGDCRRTVEQLTPYLDGALPPAERADVEASSRTRVRRVGAWPTRRRAGAPSCASAPSRCARRRCRPACASRCEALRRQRGAPGAWWQRRSCRRSRSPVLVLATGLAVFVAGNATLRRPPRPAADARSHEMLPSSLRAIDADGCARRRGVARGRFGWDVHVPPSSADRRDHARRRAALLSTPQAPFPHVMYRVGGQNVSLFMLEA